MLGGHGGSVGGVDLVVLVVDNVVELVAELLVELVVELACELPVELDVALGGQGMQEIQPMQGSHASQPSPSLGTPSV